MVRSTGTHFLLKFILLIPQIGVFMTLFIVMAIVLCQRADGAKAQRKMLLPIGTFMLLNATAVSFIFQFHLPSALLHQGLDERD
jgi:hypothetical protein